MTDTYDRRIQLGASRRRLEDAQALYSQKRWTGSMYLGGYALECSLKSLICHEERHDNFKDTRIFKKGLQGSELHNLVKLLNSLPIVQRSIELDRTQKYKQAWDLVTSLWQNDKLRYSDKAGDEQESQKFIEAVKLLHQYILNKQNEM